jgi:trigger factor
MNISQKVIAELTLQLVLQIDESDYRTEVDKALKDYTKKANIPGFRPGMVPMGMVKKMYGESLTADVVSRKIEDELDKYLHEQKIAYLGQPMPDMENQPPIDFKNQTTFEFFYLVGLRPEIQLEVDGTLNVTEYRVTSNEEDVERYVADIRRQLGTTTESNQIAEGDVVSGSIVQVDNHGQEVENGIAATSTQLNIEHIKLKTIKSKFLGKVIGDEIVFNPSKAFKNDTEVGVLLGIGTEMAKELDYDFKFQVAGINHVELAEVNEELLAKVYPSAQIKTEEELRSQIRSDIEKSYKAEAERKFYNDMVDALVKKTDLHLPDNFLKNWIIESNRREEESKRISLSDLEQQYDNYRDSLRWQLIEEHIVVTNNLIVTEEELRARIKEILGLQAFGGDIAGNEEILNQVTDTVFKNKEEVRRVSEQVLEQKLTAFFREKAQPKTIEVKYDEFVEKIQS